MLDGNPSILIGTGGTIPYGLPSMDDLSKIIKSELNPIYKNNESWKSFIAELNKNENLEESLGNVTLDDQIHNDLIWVVWKIIYQKDTDARNHFLMTNCAPELTKIISKFIQRTGTTNIITTNYDRIIEYAICMADGKYCTGFTNGEIGQFKHFSSSGIQRMINLYKVHGSVDWFKNKHDSSIISISNFDDTALSDIYNPVIVTPGNSKYKETHLDPFRAVMSKADDVLRDACAYLCIGYGFNDEHIQPIIISENKLRNKPIVIVTKCITDKMKSLFCCDGIKNCMIISNDLSRGGTSVYYSEDEIDHYDEDYWQIGEFYKLWFE